MLSGREIEIDRLADAARTWTNERLVFTHGYGLTAVVSNAITPEGQPDYLISGINRNPELPIGTHLLVAMEPAHEGAPLRWMAVTVPETGAAAKEKPRNGGRAGQVQAEAAASSPRETAAGALSRIEIPAEALQRISDRTWTGASLTISDHAMSNETGTYTDFIVLTR